MMDAALIFYPTAAAALAFTGVKLWRKYNEAKKKTNTPPTTDQ